MKWGTPTGLNRDPVSRLHGSKNFAAKREKLIFSMFSYFKAVERSENGSNMSGSGSLKTTRATEFLVCWRRLI